MSKNITSLRNHLFDQLNRLAEATENDIELEVQKSIHIVNVAEAIIKTAETENQFLLITQGTGSGFIPLVSADISKKQISNNTRDGDKDEYKKYEENIPKTFDVDKEKNWLAGDKNGDD